RVHSSPPPGPPPRAPRPRPVPACPASPARPASPPARTNATFAPLGDGVMFDSKAGVVQMAEAALPSIGTRQRSPFFGIMSARPSLLQNAPVSDAPASGSCRGVAIPDPDEGDTSETNTFDTPARSQTKATCVASGDHMGADG